MKRMTTEEICPQRERHTPSPAGYMQWHGWADTMAKTHAQVKCAGCGLYTIWVPKAALSLEQGEKP